MRETQTKKQTLYKEKIDKERKGVGSFMGNIRPIFINGTKLHVDKMIFPKTAG